MSALKIFQKQALDQVMDEEIKKHEQAFIDLNIDLNPRAENDEQLRTLILKLADMASSQIDPQAWFNQCIQAYKNLDFLNDANYDNAAIQGEYLHPNHPCLKAAYLFKLW